MPEKKTYLWMDGIRRETPDPNWDTAKAIKLGLIPTPTGAGASTLTSASPSVDVLRAQVVATHQLFGNLPFDEVSHDDHD